MNERESGIACASILVDVYRGERALQSFRAANPVEGEGDQRIYPGELATLLRGAGIPCHVEVWPEGISTEAIRQRLQPGLGCLLLVRSDESPSGALWVAVQEVNALGVTMHVPGPRRGGAVRAGTFQTVFLGHAVVCHFKTPVAEEYLKPFDMGEPL